MPNIDRVVAVVASGVALVCLLLVAFGPIGVRWPQGLAGHVPEVAYVAGGFAAGVSIMSFLSVADERKAPSAWIIGVLFSAGVMVVAALRSDRLPLLQGAVVAILGSIALVAAAHALTLFRGGETVELQSSWTGLGGGLGGWRMSPVTALCALALLSGGAAVIAGQSSSTDREIKQIKEQLETLKTGRAPPSPAPAPAPPAPAPAAPVPAPASK
jgi:hypothetical protein